jgi:hypothetical protein
MRCKKPNEMSLATGGAQPLSGCVLNSVGLELEDDRWTVQFRSVCDGIRSK